MGELGGNAEDYKYLLVLGHSSDAAVAMNDVWREAPLTCPMCTFVPRRHLS